MAIIVKAVGALLLFGLSVAWAADLPLKTDFAGGAHLLPSELKQVLALAKQSGIGDPAEVRTFRYLPGGGRGIGVKSPERVEGRNLSYDSILVHKTGWDGFEPGKDGVKRDGNFWVNPGDKRTTLLRSFEFNQQFVRIEIGLGVDIAMADKVIPLLAAEQVRAQNDRKHPHYEELAKMRPVAIHKGHFKDEYELRCSAPSMISVKFQFDNDRIVITGISHSYI